MSQHCIGLMELATIPKGFLAIDTLLKAASVKMVFGYPISTGKYLLCLSGEVDAVRSALHRSRHTVGESLVDSCIIENVAPAILPFLKKPSKLDSMEALGIVETSTCCCCLFLLDKSLKNHDVHLAALRLGQGIGGKAYFVIEGAVAEIRTALAALNRNLSGCQGIIIDSVLLSQADSGIIDFLE